eukprot:5078425-Prymnesium_polylepis.1
MANQPLHPVAHDRGVAILPGVQVSRDAAGLILRDAEWVCALARAKVVPGVDRQVARLAVTLKVERVCVEDSVARDGVIVPLYHHAIALPDDVPVHGAVVPPRLRRRGIDQDVQRASKRDKRAWEPEPPFHARWFHSTQC